MKKLLIIAAVLFASTLGRAQYSASRGFCQDGGQEVSLQGLLSVTTVQQSYPSCTVTVYLTGTTNVATIYSDATGTALANPFTATSHGSWVFFSTNGVGLDVVLSGGTSPNTLPSPVTLTDVVPGGGSGAAQCVATQQVTASTAPAKINACLALLPAAGGIVDATGLTGTQTWNSTVSIANPGVELLLGCANYVGTADPMISITANAVSVEGCGKGGTYYTATGGTNFNPTSTNGVIYAGHASVIAAPILTNLYLKNIGIQAGSSVSAYGVYLQNVSFFEMDGVAVNGNSGKMTYGYELEGVEQGEIHGGAILANALTNVIWTPFTYGGTGHQASGNGVHFHGMTLQNSVSGGINMQYAAGCCDDTEVNGNHFVLSGGGAQNIDFETASSHINRGSYVIRDNHIEDFSDLSSSTVAAVYVNNTNGVVVSGSQMSCGGPNFYCVYVTGTSNGTKISENQFGGHIVIDGASAVQNSVVHNNCQGNAGTCFLDDTGTGTISLDNRGRWNAQDKLVESGTNAHDMLQILPNGGGYRGLHILGNAVSASSPQYLTFSSTQQSDFTTTATWTSGTPTMVVSDASKVIYGQTVTGTGIAASTTVAAVSGTTITLSQNITSGTGATVTFSPVYYGNMTLNCEPKSASSMNGFCYWSDSPNDPAVNYQQFNDITWTEKRTATFTGTFQLQPGGGSNPLYTFAGVPTINRTVTLPDASGTVAYTNQVVSTQSCGTTTTCAATSVTTPHAVIGSAPLVSGTPSTATITGFSPAFSSASSYFCTVSNGTTAANGLKVVNVSSSSITITGPNTVTDTASYICIGN